MHLLLEGLALELLVDGLHIPVVELLALVDFLVVVLDHLLVGLRVHRGLTQGLLTACLLSFDDDLGLLVPARILADVLALVQLLAGPPEYGLFIVQLSYLLAYLEVL